MFKALHGGIQLHCRIIVPLLIPEQLPQTQTHSEDYDFGERHF
jgi:hypothetical protein